jgi:hypothetical protein
MRGKGPSFEFVGLLVVAGLVVQWLGSGPLLVLMWVGLGLYALSVFLPVFEGLGKGLSWLAGKVEAPNAELNQRELERRRNGAEPYWQAYKAMELQQMDRLRYLVEEHGVDPFAPWPEHIQPRPMLAETLYGYAVGTNFTAARKYFETWDKNDL